MAPKLTLENTALSAWVQEIVELCEPSAVHVCDGSEEERQALVRGMLATGTLLALNPHKRQNSYLCRSDPRDVARVESRTFICSEREADAGPKNHWQEPGAMKARLRALFRGSMRGRTLYVVPFSMARSGRRARGSVSSSPIRRTSRSACAS